MTESTNGALVVSPVKQFSQFIDKLKPQMALALPKHMKADRMARLALTAFSSSAEMQKCSYQSIASSLMTAGAMGLEPGVNGAGYLIPYKGTCTFVPGWKGLVDLVSRSGRASVWTGAVFAGDEFDYALGDRPFVTHRPGEETDPAKLVYVYAIGRVNGSEHPVIEVWSVRKVWMHRDAYNKQGGKHYSYRNPEMYARKVALLQVLKYMPSSIEVANAIAVSEAAEMGRGAIIEGDFVTLTDQPADDGAPESTDTGTGEVHNALPLMTPAEFEKGTLAWKLMVTSGKKAPNDLIAFIETKTRLSNEQKLEIASWGIKASGAQE
ncbi:MAG TPA: recombinase RecT [Burkholderiaceae bacterium]|nr:recombinase RecT [Burkholderiaceae bacterium]